MAETFSAAIAAADFTLNILTSSIFTDLGSTDIRDYESEAEMLALSVEYITGKLYNVDEQQITPVQKRAFEKLRVVVLDAEDILDRVETLIKKKKLKEVDDMVTRETNRQEICLSEYIESFANKAIDVVLSIIKKSDEVQDAVTELNKKLEAVKIHLKEFEFPELSSRGLSCEHLSARACEHLSARASDYHVIPQKVMGRDEDKTEIIELLSRCSTCKGGIPVVSVVGMGGMGKTTLAQLVYQSLQEGSHFDLLMWVSDSKKLDFRSVLKSILKCICPSDTSYDDHDVNPLKRRLVKEINGKKFLLVLDDVENENSISWEFLEDLLSEGNKEGSRVLVTTRSRKVAAAMGSSDSTYQLKGLSEEDSLQLFERHAFKGGRDEKLVEIGKLIVEKCGGVPLALKVIGAFLDGKDKHEWERVRDYGLGEDDQVMPILKMSYDGLGLTLKQCFSYCALFPKNYRISKEELSSIWKANVRLETKKGETLQSICEKNLKLLFNRCFLEVAERENWDDDDDTHYKMHDLMHDLAKRVVGAEMVVEDFDAGVDSDMLIIEKNVRHLCLMSSRTLELKGRRLRTFTGSRRGSNDLNAEKLVSGCPFLRFLKLRWCKIGNLTNSIGELIHLRYLYLSYCEFETLDSITELINLQHLTLERCNDMTHLPSEMGALISLEVLHISYCDKLMELPKDIQRLANLRRLKLKGCDALTHLPSEMGALTSLQVLDISRCFKLKELPMGIEKLTNLRRLKLASCHAITHLPSGMGALISLEVLDVSNCEKLMELPMGIEKLTNLRRLKLASCVAITHLPSGMGALISLEVLDVSNCGSLMELPKDIQRLANLRRLNLASCYAITHLPSEMCGLTSLEVLDISLCGQLKELPMGIGKLTNLKDLQLEGCWRLTQMPSGMGALVSVCTPHRLIVGHPESKHTAQLEELASVSELKHGELQIKLPYNITSKTPATDGDAYLLNNKSLRKLEIEWKKEDNAEEEEEEEEEVPTNHMDILAKLQPPLNLEKFILKGYQGETFPAWVPKDGFGSVLPNLVEIQIESCNRCRHLPALSRFPCLKSMSLMQLSSLEYIEEDLPSFPCLLDLQISGCPNLKVEPILVSFFKVFSVKSGEVEKELSEKREETMSSYGTPLALSSSSSSLGLFVPICRDGGLFRLSVKEENDGHSLRVDITHSGITSIDMDDAFRQISKHLTELNIVACSGLKTLTGLQHLTALQKLSIWGCRDFTGEAACTQDAENQWKCLQSLQSLSFWRLRKMKGLPEGIQFLTSLQELNIQYCDNLTVPEWVHNTFMGSALGRYRRN